MYLMKKTVSLLLAAILGVFTLAAQERITVSGRVTDAQTGEPLFAVGILQQGTSNGVISAMEGEYTITVPKGAVLEFSSIGYVTAQVVADRNVIDVALEVDTNLLDEVVVVGYGVQRKSSLTGAVSSVKSVDLQARGVSNINAALSGKTSGVQSYSSSARPGAAPNIQVRGIGSNGSSAPLYVIDGHVAVLFGTAAHAGLQHGGDLGFRSRFPGHVATNFVTAVRLGLQHGTNRKVQRRPGWRQIPDRRPGSSALPG